MQTTWKARASDGRVMDVYVKSALLVTEAGHRLRVSAVTDVTELRTAEAALHESNQRLAQLAAVLSPPMTPLWAGLWTA